MCWKIQFYLSLIEQLSQLFQIIVAWNGIVFGKKQQANKADVE